MSEQVSKCRRQWTIEGAGGGSMQRGKRLTGEESIHRLFPLPLRGLWGRGRRGSKYVVSYRNKGSPSVEKPLRRGCDNPTVRSVSSVEADRAKSAQGRRKLRW